MVPLNVDISSSGAEEYQMQIVREPSDFNKIVKVKSQSGARKIKHKSISTNRPRISLVLYG